MDRCNATVTRCRRNTATTRSVNVPATQLKRTCRAINHVTSRKTSEHTSVRGKVKTTIGRFVADTECDFKVEPWAPGAVRFPLALADSGVAVVDAGAPSHSPTGPLQPPAHETFPLYSVGICPSANSSTECNCMLNTRNICRKLLVLHSTSISNNWKLL